MTTCTTPAISKRRPAAPVHPARAAGPQPATPRLPRPLSERLDREWAQLCRSRDVIAAVRSWGLIGPGERPIAGLDDLLCRTGFRSPETAAANTMLCRLLDLAAGEPLAARIVLQRILPGLLAVVRAEQRRDPTVDAFDLLVGEAWLSIVRYPTGTRPTDVAARLLHDARHRAFTNPRRRRRVVEELRAPHRLEEPRFPPDRSAFEELTTVLNDVRSCGLAERHLDVVRGILRCDSSAGFAAELALDQRTVRYRRDRALHHIRRILQSTAA